jgi:hypothetical protein
VSGRASRRKVVEIGAGDRDQESIARRVHDLRQTGRGGRGEHAGQAEQAELP